MAEHVMSQAGAVETQFQEWAIQHASNSGGRMAVLEYDPIRYSGQTGYHVTGNPTDRAIVDMVAKKAQSKYPQLYESLQEQENSTGLVSMVGELLRGGNSVILATNHKDLIDVAVAQAAFYSLLKEQHYDPKTAIIISKMVSFLAYELDGELAPCVEVLKMLDNDIFLSTPRTESAKKHLMAKFFNDEGDRQNKELRKHITRLLGQGGLLLAVAASGETDKPVEGQKDTVRMAKIGSATISLMMYANTYVVPVAVDYTGEKVVLKMADIPRVIESAVAAHGVMSKTARVLTEDSDQTFVYTT